MASKITLSDASDRVIDSTVPLAVSQTPAIGGVNTLTDKTIASLAGTSETLMAANANRKGIFIKAGAAAVTVNILGATAAAGAAGGNVTLSAYEKLELYGPMCPVGIIKVIGTAANYVTAFEIT